MEIHFTRRFTADVPDAVVLSTLETLIEDWGYDDDVPANARTMGSNDILQRLDRDGHLDEAEDVEGGDPEVVEGCFGQDFYTIEQLREEFNAA